MLHVTFFSGIRQIVNVSIDLGDILLSVLENPFDITSPVIWVVLLIGAVAAVCNYLLLRRAPVKER